MKKKKLLNITLLSSVIFFSACSTKQDNIKKKSVYNIMGITTPIAETSTPSVSPDVEYISYAQQPPAFHYRQMNTTQTLNAIEWKAKSFLGVPYVWGATGPSKFDCSGFTQWVYRDAGINIPRVSRDQARVGQYVAFNNLQRGDMMFFATKKSRPGQVTHVGIYLGQGNFIHASSAGKKVVIYNLNQKPFYKNHFLWGRRVIQPNFHYALNYE
jgi:cell wall-associated NlpC family hydrolase